MLYICGIAAALAALSATITAAAASACSGAVTVARGDTLSAIARRCEVTLEALIDANDIGDPRALDIGQTIAIPGHDREQESGFVVGPGDTLGSIARELRLPASALLEANPGVEAGALPAGLVLRVPDGWADSFDAGEGPISATGVITTIECPAIRGADGQLYALAGAVSNYRPGDRVQIEGERAAASWCVPGPTIEISAIRTAGY